MPFTPAPQQSTAVDPTMLNSFMTEVLYQMEQLKTLVGENYKELSQKIQALSEQSDTRQQLEQLTALVNSRNSEFLQRVQSIADEKKAQPSSAVSTWGVSPAISTDPSPAPTRRRRA